MSAITHRGSSRRPSVLAARDGAAGGTEASWRMAHVLDDSVEEANELKDMLEDLPISDARGRTMEDLKEREAQLQAEKEALKRERNELRAAKSVFLRLK